ncbi:hypothetical protein NZD88_15455 [Chryseobacterium antibioticum]|uniref:Lipoprotein n=1 Tax=Chryseobacterium pyrolae TaxID=2987481 RepID=A0ABT2IJV6_9FLAO|nr:DUF6624 domain-containing protein [Chryseobacterium pyrolae]MCT2408942.1 hypothetical protein [Chryseobacterium pyrolae]
MYKKSNYILLILSFCFFGCKKSENYSEVRKTLEKVLEDDQKFRQPNFDYVKQNLLDRKNTKIVTKIIDSLGWLGEDKIGHDANLALFVVFQHTQELSTREKYLQVMKKAVKTGNADKRQLAYMIDRDELLNHRKQIYGTQYSINKNGSAFIENLIDPANINKRRKSMNLYPLEDYLKKIDSSNKVNNSNR